MKYLLTASVLALAACAPGTHTKDPCRITHDRQAPTSWIDDCGGGTIAVAPTLPIAQPHPVDPVVPVDPPVEDDDTPVEEPPVEEPPVEDPDTSNGKPGNASANNGEGGNYPHTGHTDNGKGQGKGRR